MMDKRFSSFEIDGIDFQNDKCKWCFQLDGEEPNAFSVTYASKANTLLFYWTAA